MIAGRFRTGIMALAAALALVALGQSPALASPGTNDVVPEILLGLAIILIAAKLGGEVFARIGQPVVLGELLAGIILGNVHLVGVDMFDSSARTRPSRSWPKSASSFSCSRSGSKRASGR